MSNITLKKAAKAKNDEFYTQYKDVEAEVKHYNLKDMVVYCNCDNPQHSNFYKYFKDNFHTLQIKHLYATGYNKDGNGYYGEYDGENETIKSLNSNGDFQSEESIEILQKSDIVITNPPFSLFRPYIKQLMDHKKPFLVIGNKNAITYKDIFPLIKDNKIWLGNSLPKIFIDENGNKISKCMCLCNWFTNIPHNSRKKPLILTKTYNAEDYPKYDNYDAIEVNKTKNIPIDYDGVMGVPISFLDKYCPTQFEIIGAGEGEFLTLNKHYVNPIQINKDGKTFNGSKVNDCLIIKTNEKPIDKTYYEAENEKYLIAPYYRLLIKKRQP